MSVVVPVSGETFFEDVQGSNLHQCSECKANFSTRVGMFLHKTKVHGYKSPIIVHFKGNTCQRCKSTFSSEKSSNDHHRCNLEPCSFKMTSAESAQEQRKKKEEKGSARSKRFFESLDSRLREIEVRNAAWLIPAGAQTVVAAVEQAANHNQSQNLGKGKPHPMGPRRVTSAAGLLNALSIISLAKADQRQTERHVGAAAQMYTAPDQLLLEIAACVWFKAKKTEKYLLSITIHTWSSLHQVWDFIHTAHMCTGAQLQDGPPPGGPLVRALWRVSTGQCGP